ncbi:hypothetical protein HanIR_Chr15g0737691 [Helianthus annuus]|nr:hypothetical protein HanIR_Chr15g0737691 [Helianthus annuus]
MVPATDRNNIMSSSTRTVKNIRRRVYTWAMNLESAPMFVCLDLQRIKGDVGDEWFVCFVSRYFMVLFLLLSQCGPICCTNKVINVLWSQI